ncbi:MAG: hypothetical protein EPO28_03915 [Saprospiraceae bacterium]|nr:MAG: hypothetical protein EPO28_03915 [Saprospiraceae bacterium]
MEENLHRKLVEKLRQENDYPGYSNEGWLSLESRLERFDQQRRFGGWLLFGLPLAALFGLNLLLLLRPNGPGNSAITEQRTTFLYDTIVNKVTVYQYDTIFRKIYRNVYTSAITSAQDARGAGAFAPPDGGFAGNPATRTPNNGESLPVNGDVLETRRGQATGIAQSINSPVANAVPVAGSGQDNGNYATSETGLEQAVGSGLAAARSWAPWDSVFALPYISLLPFEISSRQILATKTTGHHKAIRRLPLLRRMDTGLSAGVTLAQKGGTNASPGLRLTLENEFSLGQGNWSFWQSIGWQQLKLKSREKFAIPGFPLPPSPDSNAYLERVLYDRQDVIAQLGISYHFSPVKHLTPYLGLGFGGNYRLSGDQLTDYENKDLDEHFEVPTTYGSGWSGVSGHAKAGLGWQFRRLLQLRLEASYARMLSQSLAEGNIGQWWGLNATILYRWR